MIRNSGAFYSLGMSTSRAFTFGAVLLLWLCCSSLLAAQKDGITDPVEVKALQDIRNSLIDINKNLSNWRRGDPCASNWTGVLCFDEAKEDAYLHVRELQLLNMNLSGTLSPSLGNLTYMEILDFMWNTITGSIPPEIGNIKSLKLLLLNGNQLTGSLPEELGYLPILDRIQIDQNHISGPIPISFANLNSTKHFHMNNNSISGQIPAELSRLPNLVHFLLDNNNLSGILPPDLYKLPKLLILQLDNNHFDGSTIPSSYGSMTQLLKLSLRNCSLQGPMPDLSRIPNLGYLDLSFNQLAGPVPPNKLSKNITTIDLSNNNLNGTIPDYFSELPLLQLLSIANNSFTGSVPSTIWQTRTNGNEGLELHFENNQLSNINGSTSLPQNVTLWLQGNPACSNSSIVQFCRSQIVDVNNQSSTESNVTCPAQSCPPPNEYFQTPLISCVCSAPLIFGYRLKSPGFTNFIAYRVAFEKYLTSGLELNLYQLNLSSALWEGPRLQMLLKLFPVYVNENRSRTFNDSEARRIISMFTGWNIPDSEVFGPYELLYITLLGPYTNDNGDSTKVHTKYKAKERIVVSTVLSSGILFIGICVVFYVWKKKQQKNSNLQGRSNNKELKKELELPFFNMDELACATNEFSVSNKLGEGGFGPVYKGTLTDGREIAVKRLSKNSRQGLDEFKNEAKHIVKLQHRNLVRLLGCCIERDETMLVYEFLPNRSLDFYVFDETRSLLLDWPKRYNIINGIARGLLYLHQDSRLRIIHRDLKTSNILLDYEMNPKISDFGLARSFGENETEANTNKVAGTYGYISPEYANHGLYSLKSDVFSFGVLVLEIVSGHRNRGFCHPDHHLNLIGHAWILFRQGRALELAEKSKVEIHYLSEVLRSIHVGLLCVQENPENRPNMPYVVLMLGNEYELPQPKQPGFFTERDLVEASSSSIQGKPPSANECSSSVLEPRYISCIFIFMNMCMIVLLVLMIVFRFLVLIKLLVCGYFYILMKFNL